MKVVIIGSGIAGLTAGGYLSKVGYEVYVIEQFSEIGGVTATMSQDGFRWDLGPLILEGFGSGERAYKILADLGVADRIPTMLGDRNYVFPDFKLWKPKTYQGPLWRRELLEKIFPDEVGGLNRYYEFYEKMMDIMALNYRASQSKGIVKFLRKLQLLLAYQSVQNKETWSAEQLMDEFFDDPQLQAVFTSILADFVAKPSQFPALAIPFLNVENSFDRRMPLTLSKAGPRPGHYFLLGGTGVMVQSIADRINKQGGQFTLNTAVERVVLDGNQVRGVKLSDGGFMDCDLVIATGGIKETFFDLIGAENLSGEFINQVNSILPMESVLMVQLGINFDPRPYQNTELAYYYGTYEIEAGVEKCLDGIYHEGEDGFVIYIPSMHSPEMAPENHHAVTIYTIAPNRMRQGDWSEVKDEMIAKLLNQAERVIPGLRQGTITEIYLTPDDFRRRVHQKHHAFGGNAPLLGIEPVKYQSPIDGFWFIGSQSQSGGGVTNVMAGARSAVMEIIRVHPQS